MGNDKSILEKISDTVKDIATLPRMLPVTPEARRNRR